VRPACGWLSTLGRGVQIQGSCISSPGIIFWEQGIRRVSMKLPWKIPNVFWISNNSYAYGSF
jgi:hypothetical protein